MGTTVMFRALKPNEFTGTLGRSKLAAILENEFGRFPIRLDGLDGSADAFLRGLEAAGVPGASELCDAVENLGLIEVSVEY